MISLNLFKATWGLGGRGVGGVNQKGYQQLRSLSLRKFTVTVQEKTKQI